MFEEFKNDIRKMEGRADALREETMRLAEASDNPDVDDDVAAIAQSYASANADAIRKRNLLRGLENSNFRQTRWVDQVVYTPAEAIEAKARVDLAVLDGLIDGEQGADSIKADITRADDRRGDGSMTDLPTKPSDTLEYFSGEIAHFNDIQGSLLQARNTFAIQTTKTTSESPLSRRLTGTCVKSKASLKK